MRTTNSESGFTILELIVASMITLAVIGVALTTFSQAVHLNEITTQVADSNQNLRAGTNLLVRDLLQTGRNVETGGLGIPSGDNSVAIHRPSPPGESYVFDNTTQVALQAVTTGKGLGPEIEGKDTDLVTLLMDDGVRDALTVEPFDAVGAVPKLSEDGSSINVGSALSWLTGDPANGIPAIQKGDLMSFVNQDGSTIQTVTDVVSPNIYFAPGSDDPFRFNQPSAEAGTITQIKGSTMSVRRLLMFTYYVHKDLSGTPRLMRALNFFNPQALAGVIEDLTLSYDLVDGIKNPTNVRDLPFTSLEGVTYGASQVRKANLHVGVRAEDKSARQQDYVRSHLSTIIDLRNLAFVDRYK